jgi:hypothetical protein
MRSVKAVGRTAKHAHLDPYLPLHELADYSGLSVRTLRDYLTDPTRPLPHYRLGDKGKIVVRVSEFDTWLSAYRRTTPTVNVNKIVDEMLGPRRAHVK